MKTVVATIVVGVLTYLAFFYDGTLAAVAHSVAMCPTVIP
jgi:hypothetical protein